MDLPELDPLIHQRTRLKIVTLLYRNREAAFTWIRDQLELTSGNLDGHLDRLEEHGYAERRKELTADGFEVRARLTPEGAQAYEDYLDTLEAYREDEAGASSTA